MLNNYHSKMLLLVNYDDDFDLKSQLNILWQNLKKQTRN